MVECNNCHNYYRQEVRLQSFYNQELDYDICPYCSACNGVSRQVLFINKKVE